MTWVKRWFRPLPWGGLAFWAWMVLAPVFLPIPAPGAGSATGTRGMVASGHPLATRAALAVLQDGGNAIDAAVAAGLTLGVVDSHNSGIGGGCFMLIRTHTGQLVAIDGREAAPAAATRDLFVRNGKPAPELSQTGPLASGVPGELAAFDYALRHYGRKSLKELLLPAADLAEQGTPLASIPPTSRWRMRRAIGSPAPPRSTPPSVPRL